VANSPQLESANGHLCYGYGHVFGNFIWLRVLAHKGTFGQTVEETPILYNHYIYVCITTRLWVCECAGFGLMSTLVNMGVQLKASNKAENRKITQRLSLGQKKGVKEPIKKDKGLGKNKLFLTQKKTYNN